MTIAIDHDDCYTKDSELWKLFIRLAKQRGHKVICVTKRKPENKVDIGTPVIYTDGEPKLYFVENMGFKVDIWIDDDPASLYARYGETAVVKA